MNLDAVRFPATAAPGNGIRPEVSQPEVRSVTLVAGPVSLETPLRVHERIDVQTAEEMNEALVWMEGHGLGCGLCGRL